LPPVPEPDLVAAAAIAMTVTAVLVARAMAKQAFERRVSARLGVGSDGIIPGAGPIDLPATGDAGPGAPAALLLHGFGDTPQTLAYLAAALHARGWSVNVPLLPGHGRTIREWAVTDGEQWLTYARSELDALRRVHECVALVGLSMGGALAAILAADAAVETLLPAPAPGESAADGRLPAVSPRAPLSSLVLLAPYLALPSWVRVLTSRHRLVAAVLPYFTAQGGFSILDPVERERSLAYGATTPRLVHELGRIGERAWLALPAIMAPTLLVQSHGDNRTTPAIAEAAVARLTVADKRLTWVDDGAHVITVDHGHAAVAAAVGEWLDAHASDAPTGDAGGVAVPRPPRTTAHGATGLTH